MPDEPAPTLAAWLALEADADPAALPRPLRRELAPAALADAQPALALALAAPDLGPDGAAWAADAAAAALLALGRAREALAAAEVRLARAPTIAAARLRAEALLALGDREGALAAVRELVERQPEATTAWGGAGDVALAAGALAEADTAFERARELSPNSASAVVGQARVRLARGGAPEACALLEPLAEQGGATVLATLADALAASGEAARAAALRAQVAERRAVARAGWRDRVHALLGTPHPDDATLPDARGPSGHAGPAAAPALPDAFATESPHPGTPDTGGVPLSQGEREDEGASLGSRESPAADPAPSPALVQALADYFGFPAFRPGQAAVCQAVLDGRDTLAVMPTGAGKSLCFQLPAMLLDGVTLVVSPLVALMKDQLDGLPPLVYERATLLNSTLESAELQRRQAALAAGQYRLVYLAPERLSQPALLAALRRASVARVVVDEAHCVSAWGHDFRPDYLTIGQVLARLGDPPLLAVTATASPAVRADIGAGLGRQLAVLQTPLFRPNLRYEVQRLANVDAKTAALVELCRGERGSVVVYVNSRQGAEELARVLRSHGVQAAHYHAGLEPAERARVQDAFMLDRTRVIVATVAFGMGVDKANIRLVAHFSLPESLEAYVQESGRAGRDGRPARCVLLTAPADKANLTRWLKAERVSLDDLRAVYRQVRQQLRGEPQGVVDERALGDDAESRGRVALGLLDRAGLLRRLGVAPAQVTIEAGSAAPPAGDGAGERRAAELVSAGRRTYDGLELAACLDLPADELEPWLLEAQQAGWLRYRPAWRGLAVSLPPAPPDATERLERLLAEYAAHQDRRVEDIVGYAEGLGCRHARIARHFGQRLEPPCSACDRCAPTVDALASARAGAPSPAAPPDTPTMPPAAAALACLADAPFALTRTGLARVLIGSVRAPLREERTRYFGALRGMTAGAVERVVDRLLADGYLARQDVRSRDGREFSVLALTERGRAGPPDWDRSAVVPTRVRDADADWPASISARRAAPADASAGAEPDPDRFERLRAWRRQEAAAAGIAPFMVFSDATLRALATLAPEAVDQETLAVVPGIGPAKLARYGEALLALLGEE